MQPDVLHDEGARPAPPRPSRSVRLRNGTRIGRYLRHAADRLRHGLGSDRRLGGWITAYSPVCDATDERRHQGNDRAALGWLRPAGPSQPGFRPDVQDLAYLYVGATAATQVAVKLATDTDDDSSRFHIAGVDYRLITTYRGPGTEWVPPRALARSAPGRPLPPDAVRQLERGAVAILKGRRGATTEAPGLLHRSPCSADTPRLILSIDGGEGTKTKD